MKTRVCRILALLVVCVLLLGLLTACPSSTSEEAWKKASQESIAKRESREASLAAAQASEEPTEQPSEAGNEEDAAIPGKWVLTDSGCEAKEGSTDGDGQYVNAFDAALYRHGASYSYTPMQADYMLEDDDPWTERFVCTCSTMPENIFPETPFSVTIEATTEHSDAQVHSLYCYLYCDSTRITLESAGGHDYSAMGYAVYAGSSPGTSWGHGWDAPWSNGMSDTVTFTAPAVTKSNERSLSAFRLEFKSNAGSSWFDYTWVPD